MNQPPAVHLAVMQPSGYVHSLCFLDPALHLRWQLARQGIRVTMAKNRLREDAVNIVFGAHLGFPAELLQRHACVIMNLEQIGAGGANVPPEYMSLLQQTHVLDYHPDNLRAFGASRHDVPLVPWLHTPDLRRDSMALSERPIDLLFFGSMNDRRMSLIERIEGCGVNVAVFDAPLYGRERDDFILQAKAVLNCHHYPASRFEQVRSSLALSLGTPVVSERTAGEVLHPAHEQCVQWFDDSTLEHYFTHVFGREGWFQSAQAQLDQWLTCTDDALFDGLPGWLADVWQQHRATHPRQPLRPTRINLGSGKDYKPGWLNIDILASAQPDLVLDLGQQQPLPGTWPTLLGGEVCLSPGSVDLVYANNVLEHVPDLPMLMGQILQLLRVGGRFELEVPYEKACTAWQDPTHVRAMNERSWLYYTDWFWYLGWFEHRFSVTRSTWLDAQLQPCGAETAAFMRMTLEKVETTPAERTRARAMRADFGPDVSLGSSTDAAPAVRPSTPAPATDLESEIARVMAALN